jgi:site-specific DNA recombinase
MIDMSKIVLSSRIDVLKCEQFLKINPNVVHKSSCSSRSTQHPRSCDLWKTAFGSAICDNDSVKGDAVKSLVWSEVCELMRDPARLRLELDRYREEPNATSELLKRLEKKRTELRGRLDRLIDGYESGLIQLSEFEQPIGPLRDRHDREQCVLQSLRGQASTTFDLEMASAALFSLASSIASRLDEADWSLKRDLI